MYELMLDTANIRDIEEGMNSWPVVGVTTNPSILRNEGDINVYERLADIKRLCGNRSSLHVQVVSSKTADIIDEAHRILDRLGSDVFIKIPVSAEGLPAIKKLAGEGVNITATAIYSALQGILAILAGAKYIAVYYNRMENNCTDPNAVIREIRNFIDKSESSSISLPQNLQIITSPPSFVSFFDIITSTFRFDNRNRAQILFFPREGLASFRQISYDSRDSDYLSR